MREAGRGGSIVNITLIEVSRADPATCDPAPAGADERDVLALAREQARNAIPLGHLGRLEDIENCPLLLGCGLSAYLTGQTLHCDGGALASSGWYHFPKLGFGNRVPLAIIASPDQAL